MLPLAYNVAAQNVSLVCHIHMCNQSINLTTVPPRLATIRPVMTLLLPLSDQVVNRFCSGLVLRSACVLLSDVMLAKVKDQPFTFHHTSSCANQRAFCTFLRLAEEFCAVVQGENLDLKQGIHVIIQSKNFVFSTSL